MNHRKARKIVHYMLRLGLTLAAAALIASQFSHILFFIMAPLGALVLIASQVFGFMYIRCDRCDEFLGYKSKCPDFCPGCGKILDLNNPR